MTSYNSIEEAIAKHTSLLQSLDSGSKVALVSSRFQNYVLETILSNHSQHNDNFNVDVEINAMCSYVKLHTRAYFEGYRKAFKASIESLLAQLDTNVDKVIDNHAFLMSTGCRNVMSGLEEEFLVDICDYARKIEYYIDSGVFESEDSMINSSDFVSRILTTVRTIITEYRNKASGPWKDTLLVHWLIERVLPFVLRITLLYDQMASKTNYFSDPLTNYSDIDMNTTIDPNASLELSLSDMNETAFNLTPDVTPVKVEVRASAIIKEDKPEAKSSYQLSEINRLNAEIFRLNELLESANSSDVALLEENVRITTIQLHRVQARNTELKNKYQMIEEECYNLRNQLMNMNSSVRDAVMHTENVSIPNATVPVPDSNVDVVDSLGTVVESSTSIIPKGIIKQTAMLFNQPKEITSINKPRKKVIIIEPTVVNAKVNSSNSNGARIDIERNIEELSFDNWIPPADIIQLMQLYPKDSSEISIQLIHAIHNVINSSILNDRKVIKELTADISKLEAENTSFRREIHEYLELMKESNGNESDNVSAKVPQAIKAPDMMYTGFSVMLSFFCGIILMLVCVAIIIAQERLALQLFPTTFTNFLNNNARVRV